MLDSENRATLRELLYDWRTSDISEIVELVAQSENGPASEREIAEAEAPGEPVAEAMAGVSLLGILPTGTGKSICYQIPALSRYDRFAFDSFALVAGIAYAAGAGGLYRLEGDTDAAAPINAQATLPPTDFGKPQLKRVTEVQVAYRAAGPIEIAATLDDTTTYCYRMEETKPAGLYRNRCKMGRGAKAAYWQFDVTNVDGADFTLQSLEPVHETLSRRQS